MTGYLLCSVRSLISSLHLSLSLRQLDQHTVTHLPHSPTSLYYSLAVFFSPPCQSCLLVVCVTPNPVFITAIPLSQMMQRTKPPKTASPRLSPSMTTSTRRTSSPSRWQTPWRREIMGSKSSQASSSLSKRFLSSMKVSDSFLGAQQLL